MDQQQQVAKPEEAQESAEKDPSKVVVTFKQQVDRAAEELDIWAHAERDLGTMVVGEAQEARIKAFLLRELEFSYGPGLVAAINPVWDQGNLDKLRGEYKKVGHGHAGHTS